MPAKTAQTALTLGMMGIIALALAGCADDDGVINGSGLIETKEVLVSAETSGRVAQRFFDSGTELQTGDTLALIDTTRLALQMSAAVAQQTAAEANLSAARVKLTQAKETEAFAGKEFARVRKLLASGTATERQFDQVEHELTSAKLARQLAEAQIETIRADLDRITVERDRIRREQQDCHPVSPMTGVVTEDYVEAGELLSPGRPILKIARLDTVWVKVYLPAGDFANVTLGDNATVDTESDLGTFTGTVIWTSEQAEFTPKNVQTKSARADLVYAVKISIPNPNRSLKVGMPVFVTVGSHGE
jgi:HlyD family secretion protein